MNMVDIVEISYVESQSRKVQGKKGEICDQYGKEWKISELGGGHGNWLLTKNSDVLVNKISCREAVLEHYGRTRLTQKLCKQFENDIANRKISYKAFI